MNKNKLIAVISAMVLAFTAFGCKTETGTEWKDKTYCSAVIFTSQATENGVKVTMETSTEGAAIYYTTDGTVPTAESTKYSKPVEFTKDATVKAIAVKTGIENSPVSVATVSIKEKTVEVDKKADETAPANVTELTAQPKDSRVLLSWTDAEDEDVYGYEITYSGTKPINRVVLPALDSTSMMVPQGAGGTYVSGLTNGTEYTFTVKTVDTSGNKSKGVTVKATPAAVDAGELPKEEQKEFTVTLDSFDAAKKIPVIKVIREITGLGLGEAKALVEGAPTTVKEGVSKAEADVMIAKITEAGGKASKKQSYGGVLKQSQAQNYGLQVQVYL